MIYKLMVKNTLTKGELEARRKNRSGGKTRESRARMLNPWVRRLDPFEYDNNPYVQ